MIPCAEKTALCHKTGIVIRWIGIGRGGGKHSKLLVFMWLVSHSSEIRGLFSTFMTQRNATKFAIFLEYVNLRRFFVFHFVQLYCFFSGLCRVVRAFIRGKNKADFHIPKICQILKHFAGALSWEQTSYLFKNAIL